MTNPIGALRAKLSEIATDLYTAQQDAKTYERIKNASAEVTRLSAEYSEAMSALRKAEIAKEKERGNARSKDFSDIQVSEHPDPDGGGLLRSQFVITYTKPVFDGYVSKPERHSRRGFADMPEDAMRFLVEEHPERIPASIRALAPDDPRKAFALYFQGRRRGYLTGAAA